MAVDDGPFGTDQDTPLVVGAAIGVLLNDADGDGDELSVSAFDAVSAAGGTVAVLDDGGFTYTPAAGFSGPDTFGYTVSDGRGGTDTATVNVNVTAHRGRDPDTVTFNGGTGNDTLEGALLQFDSVIADGGAGDDSLVGGGADDNLVGGADNDTLESGGGDDMLDGGDGQNIAVFTGDLADFTINDLGGGVFDVIDNNGIDGDLGTDNLTGIEFAKFDDQTINLIAPGLLGPTPYLGVADSPFNLAGPNFTLEDFEDGLFNVPGVTASGIVEVRFPGAARDSVDEDDGVIDGSGNDGHTLFFDDGATGITFTFDPVILGGLPTNAGIVWTDGDFFAAPVFEAFGPGGVPLGATAPVVVGDGDNLGGTAEDRFFGIVDPGGIFQIKISNPGFAQGIEVDHLQFGETFVAPMVPLTVIPLSEVAEGTGGFVINGIDSSDNSGVSVSGAGDVNGDGFADLIIGAELADPIAGADAGESYVVFGLDQGFGASIDLSDLDGENGFRIDGVDADDRSGRSVGGAGDVNGDGISDIIIGARYAESGPGTAGKSYVVFGTDQRFAAAIDLASLDGTSGFRLDGIDGFDQSGRSVSGAGDVNGDGFLDVIIGAPYGNGAGPQNAGESYVVFGTDQGFAASIDLSDRNVTLTELCRQQIPIK